MSRPHRLSPRAVAAGLLGLAVLAAPGSAFAQVRQSNVAVVMPQNLVDARTTREAFREVLRMYPPGLGGVLKLDPSLLANDAYLATYPAVAEFVKTHPEIARNPGYFLAFVDQYGSLREPITPEEETRRQALGMWRNTMEGLMMFAVFATVVLTLLWVLRYVTNHRRWIRTSRVQTEVHGRLMERLSSNEELLAYMQSPAGSAFLQAAPIATDAGTPSIAAPFGRILWSVQAGLVLACGGIGLLIIRGYVMEEVREMLLTLGVLGVSLGAGFALAALASYTISSRLGLIESRPANRVGRDASTTV